MTKLPPALADRLFLAALDARRLPRPEREFRFAKPRLWRFDWAWLDRKVALEVEGGFYGRGKPCPVCGRRKVAGHTSIQRLLTDSEKYNEAAARGWRVIRCTPDTLMALLTLNLLERVLR